MTSDVEVDWVYTFLVADMRQVVGQVDEHSMREIDHALRLLLDL